MLQNKKVLYDLLFCASGAIGNARRRGYLEGL